MPNIALPTFHRSLVGIQTNHGPTTSSQAPTSVSNSQPQTQTPTTSLPSPHPPSPLPRVRPSFQAAPPAPLSKPPSPPPSLRALEGVRDLRLREVQAILQMREPSWDRALLLVSLIPGGLPSALWGVGASGLESMVCIPRPRIWMSRYIYI